jgi:antirestriction protein
MKTTATTPFDFTADTFDSSEVIGRIDHLSAALDLLDDDECVELADLEALAKEGELYCPDWRYGETFIRGSHFKEYAQEFAEDTGAVSDFATWPASYIDWDAAARDFQVDFNEFELRGTTYYAR